MEKNELCSICDQHPANYIWGDSWVCSDCYKELQGHFEEHLVKVFKDLTDAFHQAILEKWPTKK